ncbi:hypothetical protein [Saccharopolyspora pogona]|uniref:hypothetical protein n=1 Tax=Saccharopolyspora pogona TaxID=333966 RepID=UPI00168765D9|nr:hypothetical protein [Saccharopolyspora pogona]
MSMKEIEELELENERLDRMCFASGETRLFRTKPRWLGAVIGGNRELPYRSRISGPLDDLPAPDWPELHPAVVSGQYVGDEWAHDDALNGWCYADAPGRLAVQCTDALVAAKQYGWFVASDRRLAVVVDQGKVDEQHRRAQEQDVLQEPQPSGLLGRAKSLAGAFSREAEKPVVEQPAEARGTRLWECALQHVGSFSMLRLGRTLQQEEFVRIEFRDRSVLDIRMFRPAELVQAGNRVLGAA